MDALSPELIAKIVLPVVGAGGPVLVLLGLPGTWLVLALAGAFEWWTDPRLFSSVTMGAVLAIALAGELWEFAASSVRAKRAGAGRRGALGALVGGIVGAIAGTVMLPIPLVGSLIGGGVGAFIFASALEQRGGRPIATSMKIGRAAAFGQVLGVLGKLACSVLVYVWVVVAVLG